MICGHLWTSVDRILEPALNGHTAMPSVGTYTRGPHGNWTRSSGEVAGGGCRQEYHPEMPRAPEWICGLVGFVCLPPFTAVYTFLAEVRYQRVAPSTHTTVPPVSPPSGPIRLTYRYMSLRPKHDCNLCRSLLLYGVAGSSMRDIPMTSASLYMPAPRCIQLLQLSTGTRRISCTPQRRQQSNGGIR